MAYENHKSLEKNSSDPFPFSEAHAIIESSSTVTKVHFESKTLELIPF